MKRKIPFFSLLLLILLMLQYTFVPVRYGQASPDYVLILAVVAAMFSGHKFGAVFGLVAGMLCDFADGMFFGMKAVLFAVFGYLIGFLVYKILAVNFLTVTLLFSVVFLATETIVLGFYSFFVRGAAFGALFVNDILPSGLLSLPFVYLIYGMAKLFFLWREKKEKEW